MLTISDRYSFNSMFHKAGQMAGLYHRQEEYQTTTQEGSGLFLTSVSEHRDLPLNEQNYTFTSPAGKGVTIFMVGGGVRVDNEQVNVRHSSFELK